MNPVDILPKLLKLFPQVMKAMFHCGLVLVNLYHLFSANIVINTAFEDARGIERFANYILAPIQYICGGKVVRYDTGTYHLDHRFSYESGKKARTALSAPFFSHSILLGGALKVASLLSQDVREKHRLLKSQLSSIEVRPNTEYYRSIGLLVNDFMTGERLDSQKHSRRPGDEDVLAADKEALKEIGVLLHKHDIPFWVDCGTLLGTYRYEGVIPWDNDMDIAVLVDDFENVLSALRELDPKKYIAQDWSNRNRPNTFIRVYIRESRNYMDIYHVKIDPENKTLRMILSHEHSHWMAKEWKERELGQIKTYSFDTIFPLRRGRFDGIDVPVPNDTITYLRGKYGENLNPTKTYSEETGQYERDLSHPHWQTPLPH